MQRSEAVSLGQALKRAKLQKTRSAVLLLPSLYNFTPEALRYLGHKVMGYKTLSTQPVLEKCFQLGDRCFHSAVPPLPLRARWRAVWSCVHNTDFITRVWRYITTPCIGIFTRCFLGTSCKSAFYENVVTFFENQRSQSAQLKESTGHDTLPFACMICVYEAR